MFPGIYGFHWTPGNMIFLGAFYCAILAIATTLLRSIVRARRDARSGKRELLQWKSDFADLPGGERRCRHELVGEVKRRTCPNAFDCRQCEEHARLVAASAKAEAAPEPVFRPKAAVVAGVRFPLDRLYHRGHTCTWPELDGTYAVSLDPLATRLVGEPEDIQLPRPGTVLQANGTAWRMRKNGGEVRVLSPIDGTVEAAGGPEQGWYLKVRPKSDNLDVRHLLTGSEVEAWITSEVERLQSFFVDRALGPTLADGGALVDDLSKAKPDADWSEIYSSMFLQP